MHPLTPEQAAEIEKYHLIYGDNENYRMAHPREVKFGSVLAALKERASYLDVGCGRGEMLDLAQRLGFGRIVGVEVVDDLIRAGVVKSPAWNLPFDDGSFEVVSMFDVIEHLLPGDDERACREMRRVACRSILIAANDRSSMWQGVELHCNQRPHDEWGRLFREWFVGCAVTHLSEMEFNGTELWRIDL